jgi:hypothetical protein
MRTTLRTITALLLTAIAVALPMSVQATATPIAASAKVCHRGVPARIGGAQKCLQAGEYCATRYERQYERYGFECSTRYRPPRLRRS